MLSNEQVEAFSCHHPPAACTWAPRSDEIQEAVATCTGCNSSDQEWHWMRKWSDLEALCLPWKPRVLCPTLHFYSVLKVKVYICD